jgi:hypothetical protein
MATVLKTFRPHLELYSRQAKEDQNHLAAIDQVAVMGPGDLDEYIAFGLVLFEGLRQESQHIQQQIATDQIAYDQAISEDFISAWQAWLEPSDAVEAAIRSYESQGVGLRNSAKFRQYVRELKLQPADVAALAKADENMLSARGISLDEALRGLRTHCRP